MQKKIIALAVAGLVSGAAFAQSNVTVYGVADVGVAKFKDFSLGAAANSMANNGNSRVGFKGTEDLGGGLKANFLFEDTVSLANGINAADPRAVGAAATPYSRSAWAGVSGGFGEIQIGQNYSAGFKAMASYDATGMANYSAAVNRFGSAPGGNRNAAQVLYMSPSMGGLQVLFGHVLKGTNKTLGGTKAQNEVGVIYANGPIALGASYADNGAGAGKDQSIGGSFNFGMGRVVAGYYNPAGSTNPSKGYTLGVADVKAGPVLLGFEWAKDTGTAGKPKTTVLEAKFPLSKRTFVYATYADYTEKANDNWSLGMRHNF